MSDKPLFIRAPPEAVKMSSGICQRSRCARDQEGGSDRDAIEPPMKAKSWTPITPLLPSNSARVQQASRSQSSPGFLELSV